MRPISLSLPLALAVCALVSEPAGAEAPPPASASSRHVRATLISEGDSIQPGRPFWLGLRLQMQPGWHVYWKQPGDAGLPPRLRWTLPAGFEAQDIVFPYPHRFPTGELASYGYADDVLLLVPMMAPASSAGGTVQLVTNASWLECRETCIPAKALLGLTLPVRAGPAPAAAAQAPLFAAARERLPRPARGWTFESGADRIVLRPPATWRAPRGEVEFFGAQDNVIRFAAPQRVLSGPGGWGLELARDVNGSLPPSLQGVLVARRGDGVEAIEIEARPRPKKETR